MAFNIVDLVKEQISDQLLGQMGNVLGTDGSKTSIALGGALPGLLSGLTGAASKPGGAEALFDTVRRQDDALLDDMGRLLGGGDETSRVIEQGNSTLGSLLGGGALDKLGGVLAGFAGISRSGSGSLLGMLAPIVLGAIKRKSAESGLDAGALASLLGEQRSHIDAAMPQGLAGQLQSEGFFDSIAPGGPQGDAGGGEPVARRQETTPAVEPAPAVAASAPPVTPHAPPAQPQPARQSVPEASGGSPMRWLLPIAALVVLALLAWLFLGRGEPEAVPVTDTAVTETAEEATADLPEELQVGQFTDAIEDVVGSTSATLEGIDDEASARAALPALKDANTKLGGLAENIARLPEAAQPAIASAVDSALANLRPSAERVLGMPSIGPVVEPVLQPMLETLEGLAG